jgi:5'-phosphate synthase pdxT subunit
MVFIRAPKIASWQASVTPLATCQEALVLARQDNVLVASFHPELTTDRRVHQYFVDMVAQLQVTAS